VTETRTSYFELPQYSSGLDGTLTRLDSNEAFGNIEARAAYDDGAQGSALPSANLKPGRYAKQTVSDGYQIHRRSNAGGWDFVGGTVVPTRVRYRGAAAGDIVLSSDVGGTQAGATLTALGELATPSAVRTSSVLAAGADLGADLSAPGTTGRAYVRTRAAGERGLVVEAHNANAGPLLSLREAGGTFPTTFDSAGRLRSTVPAGLGAASVVDNIPLRIAPDADDLTALDLYGRTAGGVVPALRVFPIAGDASPILSAAPAAITLGRAAWAGGSIGLTAPAITLAGAVAVTGSVDVSDDVTIADDLTVGDQITAKGGKVSTYDSGSNFGLTSQLVLNGGAIAMRDLRHSLVWRKRILNINKTISSTSAVDIQTFDFAPRTTCYPELNLVTQWAVFDPGSAATDSEPNTVLFRIRILDDGGIPLFTGDEIYELTLDAYDPHNYVGRGQIVVSDIPPLVLNAGTNYKIQLWGRRDPATSISLVLKHLVGTIREGALLG
jgi:hypothetical protein